MSFNQKEYIERYKKEHYSQLKVYLTKDMKKELLDICNRKGISIKQFVVDAIERAKK